MKSLIYRKMRWFQIAVLAIVVTLAAPAVFAANDPTIKGALRENIKTSMLNYIETRMVNGTFYIYDAVEGKLLSLKLDKLHEGIVKKGNFYVSCADFFDENGTKIDLDFLVVEDGNQLKTIQAVVHSVDGKKRKYHLES